MRALGALVVAVVAVAVAVVAAAGLALMSAGPAGASCAAPPGGSLPEPEDAPVQFVGISLGRSPGQPEHGAGSTYRFRVERVMRGLDRVESGEVVEVSLDVSQHYAGDDGRRVVSASSLAIGPAPYVEARYRVGASIVETGGERWLHAGGCGSGYLWRMQDPRGAKPYREVHRLGTGEVAYTEPVAPSLRTSVQKRPSFDLEAPTVGALPPGGSDDPPIGVLTGLGMAGAVAVVGTGWRRLRRARSSPSTSAADGPVHD